MVKGIGLTIIADNISDDSSLEALMQSLQSHLPKRAALQSHALYPKFEHAYKLEYLIALDDTSASTVSTENLLLLSESIARPWLIFNDKVGLETELIFNRDTHVQFTEKAFSLIRWAHLQYIY